MSPMRLVQWVAAIGVALLILALVLTVVVAGVQSLRRREPR